MDDRSHTDSDVSSKVDDVLGGNLGNNPDRTEQEVGRSVGQRTARSVISSVVRSTWPVAAAAALGSIATVKGVRSRWYRSLEQPAIQPSPPVFRWVWSALYTEVAGASVAAERRDPDAGFHAALLRNMTLNTAWTWAFFRGHSTRGGLITAAALAADSVCLARRASRISRASGAAIAPYAAWTCFAVLLNGAIIAKNPKDRSPLEKHWGC